MKLKKIIYYVSLFAVGLTFAACSDVAEDNRFIYVEPAEVAKRVLIEDFTGQRCVNCPDATAVIEQLMDDYGADNIIAVGLYGGDMGYLNGKPMPLTCDEAQWYYEYFNITGQPSVKVDRGNTSLNLGEWPTYVRDRIQQKAPLSLEVTCNYDEASRNVEITINADIVQNVTVDSLGNVIIDSPEVVNGKLQVWLTEDSIVSSQLKYVGKDAVMDSEYVHNHVFRASVNNLAGESFVLNRGETTKRTFTYTVSEDWKPEDMSVVTFVFNDSGVLQAAKAPLIPKAEEPGTGEGGESEGGDEAE